MRYEKVIWDLLIWC